MPKEYRLIMGRMAQREDGLFVEEVWGIDPGQDRLYASDVWPDHCAPFHPFVSHGTIRQRLILAAALLEFSGVSHDQCGIKLDAFLSLVVNHLAQPWGLKSKDIRRWCVNGLEVPQSSVMSLD